jgi:hypothetical protein
MSGRICPKAVCATSGRVFATAVCAASESLDVSVLKQSVLPPDVSVLQQPKLPLQESVLLFYNQPLNVFFLYDSLCCLWTCLVYSIPVLPLHGRVCSTTACAVPERVCVSVLRDSVLSLRVSGLQ